MGRQTLLLPVEWTPDGWFRIPDGQLPEKPFHVALSSAAGPKFELNDAFSNGSLNPQWKFFGEYNPVRFNLCDKGITIEGKGNSPANCSPLLCMPLNHNYKVQVELDITGNAVGGLVLFYNQQASSGILADSCNILSNIRGWQFVTEAGKINRHVSLRLKKSNQVVDMYYSLDGNNWIKTENSLEVSGFNHNILSGFMALRIGLAAMGEGSVTFRNFVYEGD